MPLEREREEILPILFCDKHAKASDGLAAKMLPSSTLTI